MLANMLYDRGYTSNQEINDFLKPDLDSLCPVTQITNMSTAGEKIKLICEKQGYIAIFGDYDCDGICAIAILQMALNKFGAKVKYYIPDRKSDGYGLSIVAIDKLLSNGKPDLFLTVDCGITAVEEIEYLSAKNIETIVTDHHELPVITPNCLIVNPKQDKGSRSYDLCGAGVALRLVEAAFGREEMLNYIDIAAIATVADIVPLSKDNRIIAYYGIKSINSNPRMGITMIKEKNNRKNELTSQDISYCIAPRINAAGRMAYGGDVPKLFTSQDYLELDILTDKLNEYNLLRQNLCETIYQQAKDKLNKLKFTNQRIIVLSDKRWDIGVIGIVAARLTQEFNLPTILIVEEKNICKGSARSIDSINLYELFTSVSDLFESYGGHKGACGLSMCKENIIELENRLNMILSSLPISTFKQENQCDYTIDAKKVDIMFIDEINKLEPFGEGNPKPLFCIENSLDFKPFGSGDHTKAKKGSLDIIAFNKSKELEYISPKDRVKYLVDLSINEFRTRLSAQAIIRDYCIKRLDKDSDESICGFYKKRLIKIDEKLIKRVKLISINDAISGLDNELFGNLFIANSKMTAHSITDKLDDILLPKIEYNNIATQTPFNKILIGYNNEYTVRGYKNIFLLDGQLNGLKIDTEDDTNIYLISDSQVLTKKINMDMIMQIKQRVLDSIEHVNNKKNAINDTFALFNHLSKSVSCDIIQFNIIFYILYYSKIISVSNTTEKSFYLQRGNGDSINTELYLDVVE